MTDNEGNAPDIVDAATPGTATPSAAPSPATSTVLPRIAIGVGILAASLSWVPVAGLLLGLVAVVIGVLAVQRTNSRTLALTGIGLGVAAALISLILTTAATRPSGDTAGQAGASPGASGPAAVVTQPPASAVPMVVVPDVTGQPFENAIPLLTDLGFTTFSTRGGAADLVLSTVPRAGAEAKKGSRVQLIAEPSAVAVPDLIGLSVSDARNDLARLSLVLDAGEAPDDHIISTQDPVADEPVSVGTTIEVSAEPKKPKKVDKSEYSKPTSREFGLIGKDPEAHFGEKVVLYGHIFQFDSATGKCAFMAQTSPSRQEYSFDYSQNTMVTAGDNDVICPILDDIIEGDIVKMWATVKGAYEYETQIGGTNTALLVHVKAIEFVSSGD